MGVIQKYVDIFNQFESQFLMSFGAVPSLELQRMFIRQSYSLLARYLSNNQVCWKNDFKQAGLTFRHNQLQGVGDAPHGGPLYHIFFPIIESMNNRDNIVKSLQIWGTFFVTRGQPTPSEKEIEIALQEHKAAYTGYRDFQSDVYNNKTIDILGQRFGVYCKESIKNSRLNKDEDAKMPWNIKESHVSLSNASCLEATRAEGGKRGAFSRKFSTWLTTTYAGEKEKEFRISLFSKDKPNSSFLMKPGSAPIEYMFMDLIPEDKLKRNFDGSDQKLAQLLCKRGLDNRSVKTNTMQLAMMMFKHAAAASKDRKANHPDWEDDPDFKPLRFEIELSGTIYSEINMNQKRMSQLVFAFITFDQIEEGYFSEDWKALKGFDFSTESIGEPGLKSRIVTKGPAVVQVYLQLCAHVFNNILRHADVVTHGLFGKSAAWDFFISRVRKSKPFGCADSNLFLTCDYTAATDWMEREPTRRAFRSFCKGMGITNTWLLESGICITMPMMYDGETPTKRGVPMGLPMCKQLLTICNGMILSRHNTALTGCNNSSLGDDCIAEGSLQDHTMTQELMRLIGFKPNDKTLIAKFGCCYGEAILVKSVSWCLDPHKKGWNPNITVWETPENVQEPPFIDYFKMRLFSVFQKTNADSDCSPLFGRNDMFNRQVTWMRSIYKGQTEVAKQVFARNFYRYMPLSMYITLPAEAGGLAIGKPPPLEQWDSNILKAMILCHDKTNDLKEHERFMISQLLRMYISRKTTDRGVDLSFDKDYFLRWFADFGPHQKFTAFDDFALNIPERLKVWKSMPFYIKRLYVEEQYYDWKEVFDSLKDPTDPMKDPGSIWLNSLNIDRGFKKETSESKHNMYETILDIVKTKMYTMKIPLYIQRNVSKFVDGAKVFSKVKVLTKDSIFAPDGLFNSFRTTWAHIKRGKVVMENCSRILDTDQNDIEKRGTYFYRVFNYQLTLDLSNLGSSDPRLFVNLTVDVNPDREIQPLELIMGQR